MSTDIGRARRATHERVTYRAEDWRDADSTLAALAHNVTQAITVAVAGTLGLASSVVACVVWLGRTVGLVEVSLAVVVSVVFPGLLVFMVASHVVEPLVRRMVFPRRRSS